MSLFDSPEKTTDERNSTSPSSGGDVLLKWGHRKRSRASRAAIEDSSSSVHIHHTNKKNMMRVLPSNLSSSASMPPPPPLGVGGRKDNIPPIRSCLDKGNRRMASSGSRSTKCEKPNGGSTTEASERMNSNHKDSSGLMQSENEGKDKVSVEVIEWPRIYIALSRKEKEDDFLAMKGTKIPQRPKKRAKNIDRTLQYCFPGMWLSDVTKSRYEVREKKKKKSCLKKQKRRGLKGMENLESGSE